MMRRRILALTLVVAPALALAQTDGQVVSADTTDTSINAVECGSATADFDILWDVKFEPNTLTLPAGSQLQLFASNTIPAVGGGGTLAYCDEADTTRNTTTVKAGEITDEPITVTTADTTGRRTTAFALLAGRVVAAAGFTCSETQEKTIYVCVHAYDSTGATRIGVATGSFKLSLLGPGKPTIVGTPAPGNESLSVSWTAPAVSSSTPAATEYVIQAVAVDQGKDATTHTSARTTSLDGTIRGLVNGVDYNVQVRAYSASGNPGELSDPVVGRPLQSDGFWDVYPPDGPEQGGCASGPAGAVALLGVAAIVALGRRRRS